MTSRPSDAPVPTRRGLPGRIVVSLGLAGVLAACDPPGDGAGAGLSSARGGAPDGAVSSALSEVWAVPEDLARLRDSLDAIPEVARPGEPVPVEPRGSGRGPAGDCSPMPNAWLDLPLCRYP